MFSRILLFEVSQRVVDDMTDQTLRFHVRFEVFTVVTMKNAVF
jgi:hypothetical protein